MMDQHDVTMSPLDLPPSTMLSTDSNAFKDRTMLTVDSPLKDMNGLVAVDPVQEDRDGRIVNTPGARRNTPSGPNRVSLGSRYSADQL